MLLNLYPPAAHDKYRNTHLHYGKDVTETCNEINKAFKGMGTDEKALIKLLGTKSPNERFLIAHVYKEVFHKSLRDVVTSETSGSFGKLLEMLAAPLPEVEAQILMNATKGMGTKENMIFSVILGRSNMELSILKKAFFDMFQRDLVVTMDSDLGGDLKKIIVAALQETMLPFNPTFHTKAKAEADADAIYRAGQGRLGTDEDTFIKVLLASPPEHLRTINQIYMKKHDVGLAKAVESEFTGDAEKALLYFVRLSLEPREFLVDHFESTMRGFGTDETALSAALVRYQCVLPMIVEGYKNKFNKALRERIKGETSGDYGELLLAVLDAPAGKALGA